MDDHMTARLSIQQHRGPGLVRLALAGDVDLSTCQLLSMSIRDAIDGHAHVEIDLDRVTFLDSSGVKTLVDGQREAARHGVSLVVTNEHDLVRRVLDVTGVLHALTRRPDMRCQ